MRQKEYARQEVNNKGLFFFFFFFFFFFMELFDYVYHLKKYEKLFLLAQFDLNNHQIQWLMIYWLKYPWQLIYVEKLDWNDVNYE